jgi:hypothetical protein
MLVPHRLVAYWEIEGRRVAYVDFQIETTAYDAPIRD